MKEHESRKIEKFYETFYFYSSNGELSNDQYNVKGEVVYVDSNNYLHNLDDIAWICLDASITDYFIHGIEYKTKNEWELEVNRIKMLEEI